MIYIGWTSAFFLSICGLPQLYKVLKEGHCYGLSWGFLVTWTLGELFLIVYTLLGRDWPIFWNAIFNMAIMTPMIYFKVKPRG